MRVKECEHCGEIFKKSIRSLDCRWTVKKYCSRSCREKAIRKRKREDGKREKFRNFMERMGKK